MRQRETNSLETGRSVAVGSLARPPQVECTVDDRIYQAVGHAEEEKCATVFSINISIILILVEILELH